MKGFGDKPLAFVDIETTGGGPHPGGIIEIAIILVEKGEIQEHWSTLVNPEVPLSPYITTITGIKNEDLEFAPTFATVAAEVYERLKDRIFIAHNARFDYSFIKNSLKFHDFPFNAKTLCTVKLSRSLFPRFKRHNLDELIKRYNLVCKNRHRALDDAQAMVDFIHHAEEKLGVKRVEKTIKQLLSAPALPPLLEKSILDELPEKTGVYIFKEKTGRPIYIGKSVNIKRRVLSHFSADYDSTKELKIKEAIRDIEWKLTEGELSALILESELIKKHLPIYNRKLRRSSSQTLILTEEGEGGYLKVSFKRGDEMTEADLKMAYGTFNSPRAAKKHVEMLIQSQKLCAVRLGVEKGKIGKACFSYQLKQCEGACVNEVTALQHNLKFRAALSKLKHEMWPFQGPIGLQEGPSQKATIHVIDQWSHVGSANSQEELTDILTTFQKPDFEFDTYKIIRGFLRKKSRYTRIVLLNSKI